MSHNLNKKRGHVHRVSIDRWLEAQTWELNLWKRQDRPRTRKEKILVWLQKMLRTIYEQLQPIDWPDDWNTWWYEKFNHFDFVPPSLENALELGCGPYTNMRLILKDREIAHVFCSDPLAREYINFNRGWLAWACRKNQVLIDDHPAERTPFASDYFDLVIMINVLDHVQDVIACLNEAIRVTKRGGQLVIGQDLTGEEDFSQRPNLEDVGHPISIHHTFLDNTLLSHFSPILHRILPRDDGRNPAYHYGTYIFSGVKR